MNIFLISSKVYPLAFVLAQVCPLPITSAETYPLPIVVTQACPLASCFF